MDQFIGCWLIIDLAGLAWLLFEMYVADLGPTYDEDFRPVR